MNGVKWFPSRGEDSEEGREEKTSNHQGDIPLGLVSAVSAVGKRNRKLVETGTIVCSCVCSCAYSGLSASLDRAANWTMRIVCRFDLLTHQVTLGIVSASI